MSRPDIFTDALAQMRKGEPSITTHALARLRKDDGRLTELLASMRLTNAYRVALACSSIASIVELGVLTSPQGNTPPRDAIRAITRCMFSISQIYAMDPDSRKGVDIFGDITGF